MADAIYLVCVVDKELFKSGQQTGGNFVDSAYDSSVAHSLEEAKTELEKLNAALIEEGQNNFSTAAIFELHSYYENRPFFVQVKQED